MSHPYGSPLQPSNRNSAIQFHSEGVSFRPKHIRRLREWIFSVVGQKGYSLQSLQVVFCDDEFLRQVNLRYLQHDTLTDIITFPYSEYPDIEADIFISIERVRENSALYNTSFENELRRVIIHGVLHLCGLGDKSSAEKQQMRAAEDAALEQWETLFRSG